MRDLQNPQGKEAIIISKEEENTHKFPKEWMKTIWRTRWLRFVASSYILPLSNYESL
jgi:hypothetical protein